MRGLKELEREKEIMLAHLYGISTVEKMVFKLTNELASSQCI